MDIEVSSNDKNFLAETNYGDRLCISAVFGSHFSFELSDETSGDTETGFGSNCQMNIPFEVASRLAKWILDEADRGPEW